MGSYACDVETQEAKAGGLLVQGNPWLHKETLTQKVNYVDIFWIKKILNGLEPWLMG